MTNDHDADVATVARIEAVPSILEVVCRTTGMGFAAVARVTEDRWVACAVRDEIAFGLQPGGELDAATTICSEIRDHKRPVVIDHVSEDEIFCKHPTPALYKFQSYISMPIIASDGGFFGTLCAIDPRPARLKRPEIVGMFRLFAELIAFHLQAQERLASSVAALEHERRHAGLREQFIAVLGHDLRNPLASVDAGVKLLIKEPSTGKATSILSLMQRSVDRMAELIDHVMDLAHARLGGGLSVERTADASLQPTLEQVVGELRAAWPGRVIETSFDLSGAVSCDHARVGQLLSNLLSNALTHGAPDGPIRVCASIHAGAFELFVANRGEPIPQEKRARLFEPYVRDGGGQGLGLGLYIASEIARAHGGRLTVASSPEETRFTLHMPAN